MKFSGDVSITYKNRCAKFQKNDVTGYRDIRTVGPSDMWPKGYGCISLIPSILFCMAFSFPETERLSKF